MKVFALINLAAALAACGGGGGDPGASNFTPSGIPTSATGATGNITSSNYATVAQQIYAAMGASSGATGALNPNGSIATAAGAPGVNKMATLAIQRMVGRRYPTSAGGTAHVATTQTATDNCTGGGTMFVTVNDADNSQSLSAGDSFTVAASNCVEGGDVLNGSATVAIGALTSSHVDLTMQFSPLKVNDQSLTGTATLAMDYNGSSYTGNVVVSNATVTQAGAPTVQMAFDEQISYNASTGLVSSATSGGVLIGADGYWLQQLSPFLTLNVYPYAGALQANDKDGDRVIARATSTSMRFEFWSVGNTSSTPDDVTEVPNK